MAGHETGWLDGPWRSVRLLHRESDSIFTFPIPVVKFWYQHCFGGNMVPFWSKASKFPKFPYSSHTAAHETGWFAGPWRSVRLLHRESDYILKLPIPIATFWYQHSFGANTVRLWSKASKFAKFSYSVPYGSAWNRVIYRTVTLSAFIEWRKRLRF